MLWIAKWKPNSKCERTQKMKKKWKLNFQLLSYLKPKNEDLEACYGFLSVGTYKATPNSIEKKKPRHTKLAQPLFFCELELGKKSAAEINKLY